MAVGSTLEALEDLKFLKGEQCTVPTPYQVTVVELWAKWCGPCRQVFPHLTAIYKKRQDQGLSVVGVSIEDDPTLPDFVRGEGERMGYTVAVSTSGSAARLMERAGISGIPHAFIVDRGGKIVYSGHPGRPDFEVAIDKALKAGVQEPKKELPLVAESIEELRAKPVKELKQILTERGVSLAGLSEKQDLVDAIDKQCRAITYYA